MVLLGFFRLVLPWLRTQMPDKTRDLLTATDAATLKCPIPDLLANAASMSGDAQRTTRFTTLALLPLLPPHIAQAALMQCNVYV